MNSLSELAVENIEIWTSSENVERSGRGRSTNPRSNLYGVSKLRDLILELAIKGRLVTQDESEDPAENILKKIELDRVRPNPLGARSKRKSVSNISQNIDSVKLPAGWTIACLSDVVEIIRGITFPGSEKSRLQEPGRIACLRTTNVQDQIDWDDLLYIGEKFVSRENQLLKPKDIVMSMANSRELVGKVALVNAVSEKTTFGGFLGVLRTSSINPDFLMIFLRAPSTRASLIESSSQTTNIANISLAKLNPLVLAIPPLAEQSRIANKVNELMALCDALENKDINALSEHEIVVKTIVNRLVLSKDLQEVIKNWNLVSNSFHILFSSTSSIEVLKTAILQLAVDGKLVAQDNKDESASKLLQKIHAARLNPASTGRLKKISSLNATNDASGDKHNLPEGWVLSSLQNIYDVRDGTHDTPKYCKEGYPLITSKNLYSGSLDFTDIKYISEEDHLKIKKRSEVNFGDILFAMIGTIGNAVIVDTKEEFSIKNIALFKPYVAEYSEMNYLLIFLKHITAQLKDEASGAVQSFVSLGMLRNYPFPLPPLAEQKRIVDKVEELFLMCDQLKDLIDNAKEMQRKIADTLVEQALA